MTSPLLSPEERLQKYQAQMGDILHWAGLGPWRWEAETGQFKIGGDFLEHFGFSLDNLQNLTVQHWLSKAHPDDVSRLQDAFFAMLVGRTDFFDQVYRMNSDAAGEVTFHARGGVTKRDEQGKPTRISGTIQDVTEEKRIEASFLRRDYLLSVSNEAAQILLDADVTNFGQKIREVLQHLGQATEVDRVHVWKNKIAEDDRLYGTLVYEWSPEIESLQGTEYTTGIPYDEKFPSWKAVLSSGHCINSLVRETAAEEQTQLIALGIRSILVAPILFKGEFWGFLAFNDCHRERLWSESEIGVLQSAGLLIAGAVTRRMTEAALETEQEILRRIFETSPVGVVITSEGRIVMANGEFLQLFGQSIGNPVDPAYVDPSLRHSILQEVQEKGTVLNRNMQFYGRNGEIHEVLTTYQQIDYRGKPSLLCWAVDITDLKNTEKALKLARDLAEVATQAKSDFLARMGHEIRTPMNAILGMTYLCLQTKLTEKQRDYLQKAQTATTSLLRIVDDVLDFSELESGRLELEETPFRLSDVLREVVDVVELEARAKGIKIETKIDSAVHNDLFGDPARLRQVLLNLAGNAVKFTERGEVVLSVGVADGAAAVTPDDKIVLFFTVRDTGIGMSSEQIKKLFESFSQVDGTSTRKYGGTGLGLAISKNLVELMGGSVGVKSKPGVGSTFYFRIGFKKSGPILRTCSDTDRTHRPARNGLVKTEESESGIVKPVAIVGDSTVDLHGARVLLVEDNRINQMVATELLSMLGVTTTIACNGQEAVDAVRDNDFDLVLMDIQMPVMDGLTAAQTIRKLPKPGMDKLPILAMTAHALDVDYQKSLSAGMNDHLTKPIDPDVLRTALQRWIVR